VIIQSFQYEKFPFAIRTFQELENIVGVSIMGKAALYPFKRRYSSMKLQWTQNFSVGVEEIDSQHKELFDRINHLDSAMKQDRAKDEVIRLIEFLDKYVIIHFDAEEKYMIDYNYAGYALHKTKHDWFKKEFSDIRTKLDAGGVTPDLIMLSNNLLITWFSNHIRTIDMTLGSFLKSKI
jgi:hemerythrin